MDKFEKRNPNTVPNSRTQSPAPVNKSKRVRKIPKTPVKLQVAEPRR